MKNCILHRDLKPVRLRRHFTQPLQLTYPNSTLASLAHQDNVLITEFGTAKLTDFGTSRAKGFGERKNHGSAGDRTASVSAEVAMTAVGTPLFTAPEVLRGDAYDETVDVYSFGMTLLTMAVSEPLLDFLGARFCHAFNKKKPPRNANRIVRAISEDRWAPVNLGEYRVARAPPTINALIVDCCAADASERPSFEEVLEALSEEADAEINGVKPGGGDPHDPEAGGDGDDNAWADVRRWYRKQESRQRRGGGGEYEEELPTLHEVDGEDDEAENDDDNDNGPAEESSNVFASQLLPLPGFMNAGGGGLIGTVDTRKSKYQQKKKTRLSEQKAAERARARSRANSSGDGGGGGGGGGSGGGGGGRMERASTTGGIDSSPGGEATAEDGDVEVGFGHFDSTGNSSSRLSRALTLGNPMRRRSRTNSSAAAAESPPPFEGTDV